jgi:hypothetical protein
VASVYAPPLHKARVVVVVNASDYDHFAVSRDAPHRAACPDWADLTFLPDHDIAEMLGPQLEDGDADAVVFASNALTSSASQRAIAQGRFIDHWRDDGPSADVGVVVLHQYRLPDDRLELKFLGGSGFSLVGIDARRVEEDQICHSHDWLFTDNATDDVRGKRFRALSKGYERDKYCVWTRFELDYPEQWEALAWEEGEEDEPLLAECVTGNRVVVASRVPIDLTGDVELLGSLVAAALRPRGCVVVESSKTPDSSAFSTSLASAIDRQRFVHRVRPAAKREIDADRAPYQFFDELIIAPEWRVDEIESLSAEAVLRKLEQGGSIVATFSGPGKRPVAVRLSGQPQYAVRANNLARWLLPRIDEFRSDVWSMRALAELVVATKAAYEDKRQIPQALRAGYICRHLVPDLKRRVSDDSVDKNILATVAAYGALFALGVEGTEAMRTWIEDRLDAEDDDYQVLPSVLAQALVLVPKLATDERRERVRVASDGQGAAGDDKRLLMAYASVLFADSDSGLVRETAADESLGLSVRGELLRAVARQGMPATNEVVALAAELRGRIDRLAEAEGALEAVCIGNAALIELARRQGIAPSAQVRGRPREVDARTVENTELVKDRETAVREADEARQAGRQATTALAGILVLVTVLAMVAIATWVEGDFPTKFGSGFTVFTALSGLIGYITKKASDAGVPPWPLPAQVTANRRYARSS